MRVGLLLKYHTAEAVEIGRDLCALLDERGIEARVVDAPEEAVPAPPLSAAELTGADLLVVLGGDGTLLHGAELVADHGVPILGINLGNLGFLTSSPPEAARATLIAALDGKLPIENRMRLRVTVSHTDARHPVAAADAAGPDGPIVRYACNDAVISQGALARLIEFETFLDGTPITTYRADGLIIATPTGSSAYNLAAGGPILTPTVEAMVVSPICPHTLTNRPLVVPASSRMGVQPGRSARNVHLTVDGQWGMDLEPMDLVEVRAANRPLRLYRPADKSYFDILRAKLHWGETFAARRPEKDEATSRPPRR